jgi:hypothetical protein
MVWPCLIPNPRSAIDFVPGEKTIFFDDFSDIPPSFTSELQFLGMGEKSWHWDGKRTWQSHGFPLESPSVILLRDPVP